MGKTCDWSGNTERRDAVRKVCVSVPAKIATKDIYVTSGRMSNPVIPNS